MGSKIGSWWYVNQQFDSHLRCKSCQKYCNFRLVAGQKWMSLHFWNEFETPSLPYVAPYILSLSPSAHLHRLYKKPKGSKLRGLIPGVREKLWILMDKPVNHSEQNEKEGHSHLQTVHCNVGVQGVCCLSSWDNWKDIGGVQGLQLHRWAMCVP